MTYKKIIPGFRKVLGFVGGACLYAGVGLMGWAVYGPKLREVPSFVKNLVVGEKGQEISEDLEFKVRECGGEPAPGISEAGGFVIGDY